MDTQQQLRQEVAALGVILPDWIEVRSINSQLLKVPWASHILIRLSVSNALFDDAKRLLAEQKLSQSLRIHIEYILESEG